MTRSLTKRRRGRLLLALLAGASLLGLFAAWRQYYHEKLLRPLLVNSLQSAFGEALRYRALDVGLTGASLQEVEYQPAGNDSRFSLRAQEITVRLSLLHLVRRVFQPHEPVLQAAILRPTLYLSQHTGLPMAPGDSLARRGFTWNAPAPGDTSRVAPDSSLLRPLGSHYRLLETVEIQHGSIVVRNHRGDESEAAVLLQEINGWVRRLDSWKAQMRLHGTLAQPSPSQLALTTEIDLHQIALDSLALRIEDFQLQGELPLPLPVRVHMAGGSCSGRLIFHRTGAARKQVTVDGDLRLREGRFLFFFDSDSTPSQTATGATAGLRRASLLTRWEPLGRWPMLQRFSNSLTAAPLVLDAVHVDAQLQNGWLVISEARQTLNAQQLRCSGRVEVSHLPFFQYLRRLARRTVLPRQMAASAGPGTPSPAASAIGPELDLAFACDSLVLHDFLPPILAAGTNAGRAGASTSPVTGVMRLAGTLTGSWRQPQLRVEMSSQMGSVLGRTLRKVNVEVWHEPLADNAAHNRPGDNLWHWRGSGLFDLAEAAARESTIAATSRSSTMAWQGWGTVGAGASHFPLDFTLVAEGDLTQLASEYLAPRLPRPDSSRRALWGLPDIRLATRAHVSGTISQPAVEGRLHLDLAQDNTAPVSWLGQFRLGNDTLQIQTARPGQSFKLGAKVWRLGRQPLFQIEGMDVELLPALFGERLSRSVLADVDLDFYLEGRTDSLNIRVDARRKETGSALFQLIGYMLPLLRGERVTSGYVRFLPDQPNSFTSRYTFHWQDSALTISDFHSEDWLSGSLQLQTSGRRAVKGTLRLSDADLARLAEGPHHEHSRYRGRLFGELKLTGTLDQPLAQGNFWLFDGFFNGVGRFSMSARTRLDSSGWRIDSLAVAKDLQPQLLAEARYRRRDQTLRLRAQAQDLSSQDFLQAIANVPNDIFTGRLAFNLSAQGPLSDFMSGNGIPLHGRLQARAGNLLWFRFDALEAAVGMGHGSGRRAYVSSHGLYLDSLAYVRNDAFRLEGHAFLPFNLIDALEASLAGQGNFLAVLPDVSTFFKHAGSEGRLRLNLRGPYKAVRLPNSHLALHNGMLQMTRVAPEARDISGEFFVDSDGAFIAVPHLQGRIGEGMLQVRNQESVPPMLVAEAAPLPARGPRGAPVLVPAQPLRLGNSQLHLGALRLRSSENGLLLNIPGLMRKNEVGRFQITGLLDSTALAGDAEEFLIMGPWAHPVFQGGMVLEKVNFQFPFDESAEGVDPVLQKLLFNINWNVTVRSRRDNRYVINIPTALNDVYVDLGIDDAASHLRFAGVWSDSSFYIEGKAIARRGVVEYLDMSFRVENCGAEFDKSDLRPIVFGRGSTVITDSTNFPYNVYVTLYTIDPVTRQELPRGRFQNAFFKLTSDHPSVLGYTQEQILAALGYSVEHLRQNATDMVGIGTDNLLLRPFLRPVERELEHKLGLDLVRFSSRFTRNFLISNFGNNSGEAALPFSRPSLLRSSRLTLGKYLAQNLYFMYVGQVESGQANENDLALPTDDGIANFDYTLQLRHRLGLEYRLNPAMLLQFEYDYNPLLSADKSDPRILLRHSFPVDFPLKAR